MYLHILSAIRMQIQQKKLLFDNEIGGTEETNN